MIASVRGTVTVRRPDHVVVECGGVGYRLAVSAETQRQVPRAGKEAMGQAVPTAATEVTAALRRAARRLSPQRQVAVT